MSEEGDPLLNSQARWCLPGVKWQKQAERDAVGLGRVMQRKRLASPLDLTPGCVKEAGRSSEIRTRGTMFRICGDLPVKANGGKSLHYFPSLCGSRKANQCGALRVDYHPVRAKLLRISL